MSRELIDTESSFDVVGDGSTDCTQNLLDAFARAKTKIATGNTCILRIPAGDIAVSDELMLEGTTAGAMCLEGTDGGAFDMACSRLVWHGAAGKTVLSTKAFNRGRIRNIAIRMGQAAVGLHATAPTAVGQPSTSGAAFERITIDGMAPGKTGIQLGTDPTLVGNMTYQLSEDSWRDILCTGSGGTGILSLSPGNCKNHDFMRLNFNGLDVALDLLRGSGLLNVWTLYAGNCANIIRCSGGQLKVVGYEVETQAKDFRLLYGTMDYGTSVSLESGEVSWSDAPGQPGLFEYAGALHLARSTFIYRNASGGLAPFRMAHSRAVTTTFGSFISEQNTYCGCGSTARPYIPLYDALRSDANDLCPTEGAYGSWNSLSIRAKSWGDVGVPVDGQPIALVPFDGSPIRFPRSTA